MDCGGHKLYIPGPGDIQIILPPGSKEIPLRKDCSGHLVMIVDDYERVVHKKGGVPEPPLQMRADSAGSSAGQPSSASGNANAETTQVAEIIRFGEILCVAPDRPGEQADSTVGGEFRRWRRRAVP